MVSEPTFEEMRRKVYGEFGIGHPRTNPNSAVALRLLYFVSKCIDSEIHIVLTKRQGYEVRAINNGAGSCYHAATLGEAAIRCAWANIKEEK